MMQLSPFSSAFVSNIRFSVIPSIHLNLLFLNCTIGSWILHSINMFVFEMIHDLFTFTNKHYLKLQKQSLFLCIRLNLATLLDGWWPVEFKIIGLTSSSLHQVIDAGGKDFRFTWSRELGDLCDIYEERQSGEEGNGLLVESGGAWRKLNVQRILDESTKNHVKMRSEEAERKQKSRK